MMSKAQLLRRYRFDDSRIRVLCTLIEDDLPPSATERGRPIPTSVQVCATLRYLAWNDFQISLGMFWASAKRPCLGRYTTCWCPFIRSCEFCDLPHGYKRNKKKTARLLQYSLIPRIQYEYRSITTCRPKMQQMTIQPIIYCSPIKMQHLEN